MKIERKEPVLNFRENDREKRGKFAGQYPHIVEDKVYYQMEQPKEIHYARWDGEKYIKPHDNNIIKKSLSAHNFRVFIDTNPTTPFNERYKAVGGYHVGRGNTSNPNLYADLKDCPISKDLEVVEYPDPVWTNETKLLFKDDFFHPRHANGLYVFVSEDGINWREHYDKPIFSTFTPCVDENSESCDVGVLGLDWMPSIFFDSNIEEYVIYLRANVALGCRQILYSHSQDLVNWSTPQIVSHIPSFDKNKRDNFYYAGVYPFKNKYIAFSPHFVNVIKDAAGHHRTYEEEYTSVMISYDRCNWETKDIILKYDSGLHLYQPHVVSFRKENDRDIIYVHEGFQTGAGKLVKYEIDLGGYDEE